MPDFFIWELPTPILGPNEILANDEVAIKIISEATKNVFDIIAD